MEHKYEEVSDLSTVGESKEFAHNTINATQMKSLIFFTDWAWWYLVQNY